MRTRRTSPLQLVTLPLGRPLEHFWPDREEVERVERRALVRERPGHIEENATCGDSPPGPGLHPEPRLSVGRQLPELRPVVEAVVRVGEVAESIPVRRGLRVETVDVVVQRRSVVLRKEGVLDPLAPEERRVGKLEAELSGKTFP